MNVMHEATANNPTSRLIFLSFGLFLLLKNYTNGKKTRTTDEEPLSWVQLYTNQTAEINGIVFLKLPENQ